MNPLFKQGLEILWSPEVNLPGISMPPMLSREGAITYLNSFQDKANSKKHNDWMKTAVLAIEELQ